MADVDETRVLLPRQASLTTAVEDSNIPFLENAHRPHGGIRIELSTLLRDSIPVILSYVLQNSIQTVSVVITGRLGPNELSTAAFSVMLAFRFDPLGWCVALGGTTGLDTLGSQSFTGGKRSTDLSVHFQRCVVLLWVLFIPVAVVWFNISHVLLALGQDARLSHDTQSYLRILAFGGPGYIAFESLKKYLQCQVHYTPLGYLGSAVALSIMYWIAFALLAIYAWVSPTHQHNNTWGGIRPRQVFDFHNCILFLKLALPGILMVGTEWAAFEIVALAAGRLGSLSLAAQSVIMTTDQILNTIPFGIGIAASTRVGNFIGARSASGAKAAGHLSALLSMITGLVVMVLLLCTKDVYGYIFSDDAAVVHLVAQVMPLVASFQIADGLAGSCGGVLRGLGRQHLGALFNLVAYYVMALPMGLALAFHWRLGLQGLWIGQVVALFIVGIGPVAMSDLLSVPTCYAMLSAGMNSSHFLPKKLHTLAEARFKLTEIAFPDLEDLIAQASLNSKDASTCYGTMDLNARRRDAKSSRAYEMWAWDVHVKTWEHAWEIRERLSDLTSVFVSIFFKISLSPPLADLSTVFSEPVAREKIFYFPILDGSRRVSPEELKKTAEE
ncbi:MATE efflux family protein [Dentipellis sp. KUC8613]|nr:MATE efflux family protein [Dentipellis sp. KUC8613]